MNLFSIELNNDSKFEILTFSHMIHVTGCHVHLLIDKLILITKASTYFYGRINNGNLRKFALMAHYNNEYCYCSLKIGLATADHSSSKEKVNNIPCILVHLLTCTRICEFITISTKELREHHRKKMKKGIKEIS